MTLARILQSLSQSVPRGNLDFQGHEADDRRHREPGDALRASAATTTEGRLQVERRLCPRCAGCTIVVRAAQAAHRSGSGTIFPGGRLNLQQGSGIGSWAAAAPREALEPIVTRRRQARSSLPFRKTGGMGHAITCH